MTAVTVTSVSALFKDMYPAPGELIKQWVVDTRREYAWERKTCPRFSVADHVDNTGMSCRNEGSALWVDLHEHDCCYDCNDQADALREGPSVQAWLAEKSKRPPIEQDHSKLSNEVQEDYPAVASHPLFGLVDRGVK